MKTFLSKMVLALALISVINGCQMDTDSSRQISRGDMVVIETLKGRLGSDMYETNIGYHPANPFNDGAKKLSMIMTQVNKQLKKKNFALNKRSIQSYASFMSVSSSTPTFGISDSETLDVATSVILDSDSKKAGLSKDGLEKFNDDLSKFTFDRKGVTDLFAKATSGGSVSETVADILKMEMQEISTANSLVEALQINATIEKEVIGSNLSQADKNQILRVVANVKGMTGSVTTSANGHAPNGEMVYQETGAVIVLGILIGGIAGIIISNESGMCAPGDDWCHIWWGIGGAVLGGIGGALLEPLVFV